MRTSWRGRCVPGLDCPLCWEKSDERSRNVGVRRERNGECSGYLGRRPFLNCAWSELSGSP